MTVLSPFQGARPRYMIVAEALAGEIASGEYPVGTLIPTELELCERFKISRHTVREAFRVLKNLDLITSHQGIGTRVKNLAAAERYVLSLGSLAEMFKYVESTQPKVLKKTMIVRADASVPLPEVTGEQRWLKVEMIRSQKLNGKQTPISYARNYIHPAYKAISAVVDEARTPVFALIEQTFGKKIAFIGQTFTAVLLSPQEAEILRSKPKSPALSIVHTFYGRNRDVLEISHVLAPADRFMYSSEMSLELQGDSAS